jgi:hypothetical protein
MTTLRSGCPESGQQDFGSVIGFDTTDFNSIPLFYPNTILTLISPLGMIT